MSLRGKAYIAGAYEHPTRKAPDKSVAQLHAECARGALADAGLSKDDVDAYYCAGDAPGALGPLAMIDYMNLRCTHVDSTDVGGSSYLLHVGHAMEAIAAGRARVALITLAGRPRHSNYRAGSSARLRRPVRFSSDTLVASVPRKAFLQRSAARADFLSVPCRAHRLPRRVHAPARNDLPVGPV